jgi:hypothetical protein
MISMGISCRSGTSRRGSRGAACRCGNGFDLISDRILRSIWELLVVITWTLATFVYGASAPLVYAFLRSCLSNICFVFSEIDATCKVFRQRCVYHF